MRLGSPCRGRGAIAATQRRRKGNQVFVFSELVDILRTHPEIALFLVLASMWSV
jgi:hypothetical protein